MGSAHAQQAASASESGGGVGINLPEFVAQHTAKEFHRLLNSSKRVRDVEADAEAWFRVSSSFMVAPRVMCAVSLSLSLFAIIPTG